jgi:hypothetical protein
MAATSICAMRLPGTLRLTVDRTAGTLHTSGVGDEHPPHPLAELSAFITAHFEAASRRRQ